MREGLDNMDAINFFFSMHTPAPTIHICKIKGAVTVSYSATLLGRARFIYRMDPLQLLAQCAILRAC